MLILSKFRDFYDSIAYQKGVDKTIVYTRETKEQRMDMPNKSKNSIGMRTYDFPFYESTYSFDWIGDCKLGDFQLFVFVIGFCGKIYPVCERTDVVLKEFAQSKRDVEKVSSYIYGVENIMSQFQAIKKFNTPANKKMLAEEFSNLSTFCKNEKYLGLFHEYKTPIFMLSSDYRDIRDNKNFVINPMLKNYEFYKCMYPFQVFQELEMFIGGVLGNTNKEMVQVSDESKIVGKGFDLKYSFRKEPGTKKRGKNK